MLDDVRERGAVGGEPARKGPRRVELRRAQSAAGAADAGGPGRQLRAKCVAERMRGIGREDEDAAAAARRAEGIGGGAGRLPDAALAAEEAKRRHEFDFHAGDLVLGVTVRCAPLPALDLADPRRERRARFRRTRASSISPSSSRICASSSCSRSAESSWASASAAATTLSSTNRRLPMRSESRMNMQMSDAD